MKTTGNKSEASILREKAEELLKRKSLKPGSQLSEADLMKLFHELEVHKIELEMQHLELIMARSAAPDYGEGNEEKYKNIFENIQDVYYETSLAGIILEVSPSIEEFSSHAYKREELIGKSMNDFYFSPEERDVFIEELKNRKILRDYEVQLKNRDGSVATCSVIAKIHFDADGTPEKIIGTLHNVNERKLAELALLENEAKYRTMITQSPDGIFIVDLSGVFLSVNRAMCDNLKYSEKEFLSMKIWDIVPQKYLSLHMIRVSAILNGEIINKPAVYEIKGKDGIVHFVEILSAPYFNNKELIGFQGIARDITERKQTEEVLRKSEKNLKEAQRLARIGSWDWDATTDTITWSEEYYHIYDLDPTQKPPGYVEHLKVYTPESAALLDSAVKRNMETGEPYEVDLELVCKEGPPRLITARSETKRDAQGKIIGLQGTAQDITERKRVEERLRKSEYELRLLAEAMPQIVWITDQDGWTIYLNQQWVDYTGLTLEESYGQGWNKPFHPDDQQEASDSWQIATKNGATYSLECRLRRADGIYKWWLIRGVPVLDELGTILKWFGTCTDIDDLKQAENELRKLNETLEKRVAERTDELENTNKKLEFHIKEIKQYTHLVSHDLQEPLRTLTNFTQLIQEGYAGKLDEDLNKYIEFIYDSASRMRSLVKDLLDYSLLGKEHVMTMVDCKKVIGEVLADLDESIKEGNATISMNDLPIINGYETELRVLFQNLINNAIKFRKNEICPEITIKSECKEKEWIFAIKDNGIGIEEKDKEKIFIIFKQMHNRDVYKGTGIGLANCKKIVELHGGKIWVESTPGDGSIFIFTIPKH